MHHTEEATFLKLKRTPFNELRVIVHFWIRNLNDETKIEDLLAKHSWTLEDWQKEVKRHPRVPYW